MKGVPKSIWSYVAAFSVWTGICLIDIRYGSPERASKFVLPLVYSVPLWLVLSVFLIARRSDRLLMGVAYVFYVVGSAFILTRFTPMANTSEGITPYHFGVGIGTLVSGFVLKRYAAHLDSNERSTRPTLADAQSTGNVGWKRDAE